MTAQKAGVDPRTTALVIVDVQNGFINMHSRGALPSVVRLVQTWTELQGPVVFARFHNPVGSPYERFTGWNRLRTEEEQRLADELLPFLPSAAGVIEKSSSSLFSSPETLPLLQAAGWQDLVFAGIDTDACVYDSAVDAYHAGYRPWIVSDACSSSGGSQYHNAALLLAERNIGRTQVITVDELAAKAIDRRASA